MVVWIDGVPVPSRDIKMQAKILKMAKAREWVRVRYSRKPRDIVKVKERYATEEYIRDNVWAKIYAGGIKRRRPIIEYTRKPHHGHFFLERPGEKGYHGIIDVPSSKNFSFTSVVVTKTRFRYQMDKTQIFCGLVGNVVYK